MNLRISVLVIACLVSLAACHTGARDATPYMSESGLIFEIDDGTGIFYSGNKTFVPIYCDTKYPVRAMDIGQENFNAISDLVTSGDIWTAKVEPVPGCQILDVARQGQHYKFEIPGKSISLDVGQCQRIDPPHEPYIKAMSRIVRTVSDRQTLRVRGQCAYF